jgi:hypothetical protein
MPGNGGVQSRQFTEPEQVTTAQGGVFCQVVPAGSGLFEAALHSISMGDVTLNMGQVSPCMALLRTTPFRVFFICSLLPCIASITMRSRLFKQYARIAQEHAAAV